MTIAAASQRTIRVPEMPIASRIAAMANDRKSRTPWTTPQPIDPKTHSPERERDADDEEEDGEDDEDEGERTERDDPTDLAGDRRCLGLGQVDMGDDERHRRVTGRADLGAKARRWHPWTALVRWRGRRGRGVRGGGSGGVWSSRGVLRLRIGRGGQPR